MGFSSQVQNWEGNMTYFGLKTGKGLKNIGQHVITKKMPRSILSGGSMKHRHG